jgi:hypothetical protein
MDEQAIRRAINGRYHEKCAELAQVTAERDRLRRDLATASATITAQLELLNLAELVIAAHYSPK